MNMRHAKRTAVAVLAVLLASVLPAVGAPRARAQVWRPDPGDWIRPQLPTLVPYNVGLCRAAQYNAAYLASFAPLYQSLGIPVARQNAVFTAASHVAGLVCAGYPREAHAAFGVFRARLDELADSYASRAGVSRLVASTVLRRLQLTLLANAFACFGRQQAVGDYLTGGNPGPINIVGAPVSGGSSALVPLSPVGLGSCGGGGGGGGGSGGGRDLAFPGAMDAASLAQCVSRPRAMAEGCPVGNEGDEDEDQAQDALDAVHSEELRTKSRVTMERSANGTITITDDQGNSIMFVPNQGAPASEWIDVFADLVAMVQIGQRLITLLEGGATGGPIGFAAVGLVLATIALKHDIDDVVDDKPASVVIKPGKLCPVTVQGGRVAWWTNPAGSPLDGADVFSVCTCNSVASGQAPTRCRTRAEAQIEASLGCAIEPYATPVDAELCARTLTTSNPWLERGRASAALCGYKDCGRMSPVYSAATDTCGCSTSSGGVGGGIWIPDFGFTDPLP